MQRRHENSDRVLGVVVEHVGEVRLLVVRRRLLCMWRRGALPLHALVVPVRRQALVVWHRDGAPLELPPVLSVNAHVRATPVQWLTVCATTVLSQMLHAMKMMQL